MHGFRTLTCIMAVARPALAACALVVAVFASFLAFTPRVFAVLVPTGVAGTPLVLAVGVGLTLGFAAGTYVGRAIWRPAS
jgi:hypothetical protein